MNQEDYIQSINEERKNQELKDSALFNFMTKEARERFRRVEMVHPELAGKALMTVLQGVQTGRVKVVDDNLLKTILENVNGRKEFNILNK